MSITPERLDLYDRLSRTIGNTQLRRLRQVSRDVDGDVMMKQEFQNPTGSHYDRLMLWVLRAGEETGEYVPGHSHLLDATSGNSGASLAWLCRVLSFRCTIVIPGDVPSARLAQIRSYGATVLPSPPGQYVSGAIRVMMDRYTEGIRRKARFTLVNHAAKTAVLPQAASALGQEMVSDLKALDVDELDYLILALGNGSTLGVIPPLKEAFGSRVVGFEPAEDPANYVARYARMPRGAGGESSGASGSHGLLGTGPGETSFGWPLLVAGLCHVDEIRTISRPEWEPAVQRLADLEGLHCGRTTAAAYLLSRQLGLENQGARTLFLGYDSAWKYLDLEA